MTNGWLKIGKVGKAHGLRGAFFVRDRDELVPKAYGTLRVGAEPASAKVARIKGSQWQNGAPLLMLDIVPDRTAAEELVGQDLWVERRKVSLDEEAEFLWSDLEGRKVTDSQDRLVGTLVAIYNTGSSDIAVVENEERGHLEIALIGDYFDMDFSEEGPIRLSVEASLFDDLWQAQG